MVSRHELEEAIDAIRNASDEAAAQEAFSGLVRKVGFDGHIYLEVAVDSHDRVQVKHRFCTVDHAFLSEYDASGMASNDPALRRAMQATGPFRCLEVATETAGASKPFLDPSTELLLRSGFTDGLALPTHGRTPAGEYAFGMSKLLWTRPREEIEWIPRGVRHMLHLAALHLHERSVCARHSRPFADAVILSSRELDILSWAATGKTSSEIAALEGVSEATVNFHFKNAMRKLDVHTRPHAVTRAISLGLISV